MSAKVSLSPHPLTVGYVAIGFAYSFTVTLTNVGPNLDRFKVVVSEQEETRNKVKCVYAPQPIAPGMNTVIKIILHAKESNQFSFPLSVTRGSTRVTEVFDVTVMIVPTKSFKKIAHNLRCKNKDIYSPCVECIGSLSFTQSSFLGEGAPSLFSENLMTEEDFEDLKDVPFVRNVYWNPHTKCLVHDSELSAVLTGKGWSLEESKEKSNINWDTRLMELEAKGMVTQRVFDQMVKERSSFSATSSPTSIV